MVGRLHEAIKAVCPVITVRQLSPTSGSYDPAPVATQQQRDAADAALAAFDWSQAAHDAWLSLKNRASATSRYDDRTELAKLVRAVVSLVVDELNVLRGQVVGVAIVPFDPANMANGTGVTSGNIAVVGADFGDVVDVSAPYSLAGIVATGYVASAGNVVIRLHNSTGGAVNLANGSWSVCVRRPTSMSPRTMGQARAAILNVLNSGAVD